MGFNIKNNYGPNIEVKDGGRLTLVQGKDGLWHTADAEEAEYEEIKDEETDDQLHDDAIDVTTENNDAEKEPELNFSTPRIVFQNMLKAEKVSAGIQQA